MITAYLAGTVATVILFAVRTPDTEVRAVALLACAWPVSLIVIALTMLLAAFGYDFDVKLVKKLFGFRRPTNPNVRGFALTVLCADIQIWKALKV